MKYAELICALVMSIMLMFVYIKQCIVEHRILKVKLLLSFVCVALVVADLCFYDTIKKHDKVSLAADVLIIAIYIFVGASFFLAISGNVVKSNLENEFLKSLENDKIFILLDKKEKIKQISSNLTRTAGVDRKDVIGKKFFDFLGENFVLLSLNDTTVKMSNVKENFRVWSEECKEGDSCKREFLVSSKDGKETNIFNFTDTPIFTASRYTGHLLLGDLDDEASMLSAERRLSDKSSELSSLKARFSSYLKITNEAAFFYNIDEHYIWGNDAFVKELNLNGNTISRAEFEKYIHPDDLAYYNRQIAGLTEAAPAYDLKYRFKTGISYQFVRERGRRVFAKGADDEITGTIELVSDSHFQKNDVSFLDTIKDEPHMYADIENAYRSDMPFELVMLSLTNLPEINKTQGRNIGNMVLEEYVKALKEKLVNGEKVYRISGLEFVIIIEDGRKMTILKQLLEQRKLTNVVMNYGSISVDIEAHYGVAFYSDADNANDLVKASQRALNTAKLPQVDVNYMFYRDIK